MRQGKDERAREGETRSERVRVGRGEGREKDKEQWTDLRVDEDHIFGEYQANDVISIGAIDWDSAVARAEDIRKSLLMRVSQSGRKEGRKDSKRSRVNLCS
jgi:co-chaperonin GroES (HSP10)